jgi:hypothetical protein
MTTFQTGDKVSFSASIFPPAWVAYFKRDTSETLTGTVQKVFKNGNAAIAIHQFRNSIKGGKDDGLKTINIGMEELALVSDGWEPTSESLDEIIARDMANKR